MKQAFLCCLIGLTLSTLSYSQEKIGIVPLNTPWILGSSFRPSLQIKTTGNNDWLVLGWIKGIDKSSWGIGGENGFNIEYRINLKRDQNLEYKTHSYIGFYYSRVENTDLPYTYSNDYRRSAGGILFATTLELDKNIFMEIFCGFGRGGERDISEDKMTESWDYNYLDFTGGLNIGFRF